MKSSVSEADVLHHLQQGDAKAAAAALLSWVGEEVSGFILGAHRDRDEAADVFSLFCEDVLAGMGTYQHRGSLRAWAYAVARHASSRFRRQAARRKEVGLSHAPSADGLAQPLRTGTQSFLKTSARSLADELRGRLSQDERDLLSLRVDRKLSWSEVAQALDEPANSTALRKRFERTLSKLREWAAEERSKQGRGVE